MSHTRRPLNQAPVILPPLITRADSQTSLYGSERPPPPRLQAVEPPIEQEGLTTIDTWSALDQSLPESTPQTQLGPAGSAVPGRRAYTIYNVASEPKRLRTLHRDAIVEPISFEGDSPQARQRAGSARQDVHRAHSPGFVQQSYRGMSVDTHARRGEDDVSKIFAVPRRTNLATNMTYDSEVAPAWVLNVRQQPQAARACGYGERDRRVIDPPPILQVHLNLPANQQPGEEFAGFDDIRLTTNVLHVSLYDEEGLRDVTSFGGERLGARLMGTLVATAVVCKDEHGTEGAFFAFPDLLCRTHGRFRLRFSLFCISMDVQRTPRTSSVVTTVMSDIFTVYPPKDFRGVQPSTPLTHALREQGVGIYVSKGRRTPAGGNIEGEEPDSRQ